MFVENGRASLELQGKQRVDYLAYILCEENLCVN